MGALRKKYDIKKVFVTLANVFKIRGKIAIPREMLVELEIISWHLPVCSREEINFKCQG